MPVICIFFNFYLTWKMNSLPPWMGVVDAEDCFLFFLSKERCFLACDLTASLSASGRQTKGGASTCRTSGSKTSCSRHPWKFTAFKQSCPKFLHQFIESLVDVFDVESTWQNSCSFSLDAPTTTQASRREGRGCDIADTDSDPEPSPHICCNASIELTERGKKEVGGGWHAN